MQRSEMNQVNSNNGNVWNIFWWVLGTVLVPFTVPWLFYNFYQHKKAKENLQGKVVLITGASSGLGEALAHVFYRVGCKVILASRKLEELQRVKADLLAAHPSVETFSPEVLQLDLSDLPQIPSCAKKALQFHGHVDILINNGGISFRGSIQKTSVDVDLKVMMVNYFGQICLTKALLPSMIEHRGGHIVAVSSVQGRISIPHRSAYAASKHALQAFCDCLRAEVARQGIKVTVVSPGYIKTNISLNALTATGEKHGIMDDTTANGYTPEEVAEKVLIALLKGKNEILLTPLTHKIATFLRILCPSLYFQIMQRRALKSNDL